jgi:DNA-directed RNA polymerase specialized sigma24 family protein
MEPPVLLDHCHFRGRDVELEKQRLGYERMIYATAIAVLKNPADPEEVAQEAIMKAFSNLAGFRGESKAQPPIPIRTIEP